MDFLTEENYFSKENELKYIGSSQFKDFLKCETEALKKINGEIEEEKSTSLLASSYIDEYFSGTIESFKEKHPEMFSSRGETKGQLKSEFKNLDDIINQAEKDPKFMKYINGEHQVIMTGEIEDVPVKIKIDSYFKNKCIVDLKAVKDFNLIWNDKDHCKDNFIDFYDYTIQAAIYQEIVRQNTGVQLPFIIAALTKEKISERALLNIPQEIINEKLAFVKSHIKRFKMIKDGLIEPTKCGKCDYCKSIAKIINIYNYKDYFNMRGGI